MKAKLREVKLRDKVAKEDWGLDWKSENTRVDQWALLCSHGGLTEGLGAVRRQEDILERCICRQQWNQREQCGSN